MKVAENDLIVHGMLVEEYDRCKEALQALMRKVELLPKGSLHVRKKRYKGKEYAYHYLVLREAGRVVNRHVPEPELPDLREKIAQRDKYKKEIRAYQKRMAYLEKLLKLPHTPGEHHASPA